MKQPITEKLGNKTENQSSSFIRLTFSRSSYQTLSKPFDVSSATDSFKSPAITSTITVERFLFEREDHLGSQKKFTVKDLSPQIYPLSLLMTTSYLVP